MIEYREIESAKRRLIAHYNNLSGEAIFPIDKMLANDGKTGIPFLESTDFLINVYPVINFFKLYLTARRMILKREEIEVTINYENVIAVYLEFPFKKTEPPHYLNIIMDDKRLLVIDFLDVQSLVSARNEIYKIIDVMIIDWKGRLFKVGDVALSELELVKLPQY